MKEEARRAAAAVDGDRLWRRLMRLAEIGATPAGGVNRQALSPEDTEAKRLVAGWAAELGFEVRIDEIGNLFVRRPGRDRNAAPVLTGSHLDSQPTGGKFDGAYGVMAGFEALEALERAGIETARPVEAVAWTNEEGSRFQPGCMGSAVYVGAMDPASLMAIADGAGITVEAALRETLAALPEIKRRESGLPVAAYVEAHIEQGPRLETEGIQVGAVTGIQGSEWFAVEIIGEEAHAGTTPLRQRKDALKAACTIVGKLEALMADESDTVRFTVGRFEVQPNSPNTVPGRVFFTIDFRHPELATIERLAGQVEAVAKSGARGCEVRVTRTRKTDPTHFDAEMVGLVSECAAALDISSTEIFSGAGHDAQYLAEICPSGMIFVPCGGGVSHNEAESATPEDLAHGTRVLAACLAELAGR